MKIRGEFTELFKNKSIGQVFIFFQLIKIKLGVIIIMIQKLKNFFLIAGKVKFDFIDVITKKKYSMRLGKNNKRVVLQYQGGHTK